MREPAGATPHRHVANARFARNSLRAWRQFHRPAIASTGGRAYLWDMIGMFASLRQASARDDIAPDMAMAALLVEAARADGHYDPTERATIDRMLAALLGTNAHQAQALRTAAEPLQAKAPDTVRFTRVVKFALDYDQRVALIEALWHVVLSDDHRDPHENALMRRLPPLLGVDDHDSARARQRASGKS